MWLKQIKKNQQNGSKQDKFYNKKFELDVAKWKES